MSAILSGWWRVRASKYRETLIAKFRWCVYGCSWHCSFNFSIFSSISKLFRSKCGQKVCKSHYSPHPNTGCLVADSFACWFPAAPLLFLFLLPFFTSSPLKLSVTEAKIEQDTVQDEINSWGSWVKIAWVSSKLCHSVTLDMWPNYSVPQLTHLRNGANNNKTFIRSQ